VLVVAALVDKPVLVVAVAVLMCWLWRAGLAADAGVIVTCDQVPAALTTRCSPAQGDAAGYIAGDSR